LRLLLSEGQQSDHKGAATLLAGLPASSEMIGELPLERHWSERQWRRIRQRRLSRRLDYAWDHALHPTKSKAEKPRNLL